LQPFRPADCVGRLYNRLNDDYRPMHALSRFFLEHSGPTHELGDRVIMPFLVNMGRLFELFVSEWLKAHLPDHLMLSVQEKVSIGETETLHFEIDLVLSDASTGKPICVLDTKYKADDGPSQSDVAQVVTYAQMKSCRRAVLIYPVPLPQPLNHTLGDIHLRSMTFGLQGDLEERGTAFLGDLAAFCTGTNG
jgi:5-methylcytosine-specific restriction enzyme subunit McrC